MPTIQKSIAVNSDRYKANNPLAPVGVVLHSVGCPQPSAEVFVKKWQNNSSPYFTHYVLDDQDIHQVMPHDRKCYHVGSPGNSKWLGIEMCEPKQITYTSGAKFTVSDLAAAQAFAKACYNNAVWLLAKLCTDYGWDPATAVLTHNEVSTKGLSNTDHVDPEHLWKGLGLSYSLSTLRKDVAAAMGKAPTATTPAVPIPDPPKPEAANQMYRIRKSWADSSSQIGAYKVLEYAIAACLDGYAVFDKDGVQVYPAANVEPEAPSAPVNIKLDVATSFLGTLAGEYTVMADFLNVRSGAGTDKAIIAALPYGTKAQNYGYFNRTANGSRWLYVVGTLNGKKFEGYCSEMYLRK